MAGLIRVLVTSAGSSPGLDILRCLRRDRALYLAGADADTASFHFAAPLIDASISLPRADAFSEKYVEELDRVSRGFDFLFVALDKEVEALVDVGQMPSVANALAPLSVLRTMLDKHATARCVESAGLAPRTHSVTNRETLAAALSAEGGQVWLRPATGSSGQGSLVVRDAAEGDAWMRIWRARGLTGTWIAQEFLPGRNINWTGVFRRGSTVASAAMQRLSYWLGNLVPSGVTGQVREAVALRDEAIDDAGRRVVDLLDPDADGIYSVDLREDATGRPRLNEVNPRPAGRPWLYANAGVNLPLAALRSRLSLPLGDAVEAAGLRPGVRILRQLDAEPVIIQPQVPDREFPAGQTDLSTTGGNGIAANR